ncbi:MAG: cysteine desulfurase NifS [Syntrophales bacterium]|nr:cysteine desulfurase NifS [Syntrophales bacterium]
MRKIYLDYAATTPMHPQVLQAMLPYFTNAFGNPSSIHSYGQEARRAVEEARERVAELIGARADEIIFTCGGTEADNFALKGTFYANKQKGNHIITSKIEHHAILETCKFLESQGAIVTYLPVDKYGLVDPRDVQAAITNKTILISIMHANNEVGTIQPIPEIGKIAGENGILFHSDAVQTTGHIPVNISEMGVDMLSMSAHKLYGPKGIGAMYIRRGARLVPFMHGGEQERRRRASTENVPGIIGFGKAAELAQNELDEEAQRLISLRTRLIDGLFEHIDQIILNGHPTRRLPNNVNVSVDFVEGEALLLNLDLAGIAESTGSACSSSSSETSHVLRAMGLSHEQAQGSLRLTMGRETIEEDIDRVIEVLPPIVDRLRELSPTLTRWIRDSSRSIVGCCPGYIAGGGYAGSKNFPDESPAYWATDNEVHTK